jgi:hypothetical protein
MFFKFETGDRKFKEQMSFSERQAFCCRLLSPDDIPTQDQSIPLSLTTALLQGQLILIPLNQTTRPRFREESLFDSAPASLLGLF